MSHEAAVPEVYVPFGDHHWGACKLHNRQYYEPYEHKGKEFWGKLSVMVMTRLCWWCDSLYFWRSEFVAHMDENVWRAHTQHTGCLWSEMSEFKFVWHHTDRGQPPTHMRTRTYVGTSIWCTETHRYNYSPLPQGAHVQLHPLTPPQIHLINLTWIILWNLQYCHLSHCHLSISLVIHASITTSIHNTLICSVSRL